MPSGRAVDVSRTRRGRVVGTREGWLSHGAPAIVSVTMSSSQAVAPSTPSLPLGQVPITLGGEVPGEGRAGRVRERRPTPSSC